MFETSNVKPKDLAPNGSEARLLSTVKEGDVRTHQGRATPPSLQQHPKEMSPWQTIKTSP